MTGKRRIKSLLCSGILSLSLLTGCQAFDNLLLGVSGIDPNNPNTNQTGTNPDLNTNNNTNNNTNSNKTPQVLSFPATHKVPYKTLTDYLSFWNGTEYEAIFLKGVNLGIGVPGTRAGDLSATSEQYARWFKRMTDAGMNNLRIYTLHYPRFYEEFAKYNANNPDKPLYLFHGVWLDEHEQSDDLYKSTETFDEAIREIVDTVNGNYEIGQRFGRAYGKYTTNISKWVMGYIIGREIDPEEIILTDERFPEKSSYSGKNLRLPNGTASEVWAAERIDKLITHERTNYGVERPISFSSWPTLDPLKHPTENELETSEDVVGVDLSQIDMFNAPAGYFPSFHAYPYYPNFIVDDPGYNTFNDREGVNNYLGYLNDLKNHYKNMPLIIAEYGAPSSWGNAHFSPSGIHHGGHDEINQGKHNARMTRNLLEAKTGGGMVFAWIDEWWKRTWIVDERTFPRERYAFWHNLTSPEENFGLIAFDYGAPNYTTLATGSGRLKKVDADHDPGFFRVRVEIGGGLVKGDKLVVGYNTYRDDLGETILPNKVITANRNEFAAVVEAPSKAELFVTQAYDLFRIWHGLSGPEQIYQSTATSGAPWNKEFWQNGQVHTSKDGQISFPETLFPIGDLQMRSNLGVHSSKDAVIVNNDFVEIKIPWAMLQFTDPSTLSVMHDDRSTKERETARSEGIALSVSLGSELIETRRYTWKPWDKAPLTIEREKPALEILAREMRSIPDRPPGF